MSDCVRHGQKQTRKKQENTKKFFKSQINKLGNFTVEMGGLFGKQKKPQSRITEQDKAILVSESN